MKDLFVISVLSNHYFPLLRSINRLVFEISHQQSYVNPKSTIISYHTTYTNGQISDVTIHYPCLISNKFEIFLSFYIVSKSKSERNVGLSVFISFFRVGLWRYKRLNFISLPITPFFQWQSKTVSHPTPLSILIIVELVLVLNMHEIYATGL